MISVEDIELAVGKLSVADFVRLRDWILEKDSLTWDQQMEQDEESGKLDFLIGHAKNAKKQGQLRSLDDLQNDS